MLNGNGCLEPNQFVLKQVLLLCFTRLDAVTAFAGDRERTTTNRERWPTVSDMHHFVIVCMEPVGCGLIIITAFCNSGLTDFVKPLISYLLYHLTQQDRMPFK